MILFTVHDVILLALAVVCAFQAPQWLSSLSHNPSLGFARGLLLSAPFLLTVWAVALAVEGKSISSNTPDLGKFWLLCLGAALYVALAEELLLRGMLQSFLQRFLTIRATLWLQGLIFALLHIPAHGLAPLQLIFYFLAGVLLTLVFVRWRNIWTAIGVHAAWDVSAFALQGFYFRQTHIAGFVEPHRQWVVLLTFTLSMLIAVIVLLAAKETQTALAVRETSRHGKRLADVKNEPG